MAALKYFGVVLIALGLLSLAYGCIRATDGHSDDPMPANEKKMWVNVFLAGAGCTVVGFIVYYLGDRPKKDGS
jgi:hypothetical protein